VSDITKIFVERFVADFSAIAAKVGYADSLDVPFVRSVLEHIQNESEARFSQRCNEAHRAYSFVLKNDSALKTFDWLQVDLVGGTISGSLLSALYFFFCGSDMYANRDPNLDLVINAAIDIEGRKNQRE
jgi:hypothetical protein